MICDVTSDLHLNELTASAGDISHELTITSRYQISLPIIISNTSPPIQTIQQQRKKVKFGNRIFLTIRHKVISSIDYVGEQLWRGTFILSDYLIFRRNDLQNCIAFELGSGVGFLSIVASLLSFHSVYMTDYHQDIINLGISNLDLNSHLISIENTSANRCPIYPRVLDWFQEVTRSDLSISEQDGCHADDTKNLDSCEILWLAADVIYDDSITEAFFQTLSRLMKKDEKLWLALEKRFNFEVEHMSLVAHGYNRFLNYVEGSQECLYTSDNDKATERRRSFTGHRISLLFPQYVEYDRTKDMELWEITPLN